MAVLLQLRNRVVPLNFASCLYIQMIEKKIRAPVGLVVLRFNCDNPLGDHLDKYEVLKHLNGPRFTTIVGLPGSGKTSMALSWLTGKKDARVFRRVFDNV